MHSCLWGSFSTSTVVYPGVKGIMVCRIYTCNYTKLAPILPLAICYELLKKITVLIGKSWCLSSISMAHFPWQTVKKPEENKSYLNNKMYHIQYMIYIYIYLSFKIYIYNMICDI